MSAAANIRDYLLTKTAITNYVGDRIFSERAPQRTPSPYLIFNTFDRDHLYHLANESTLASETIQIDVVARGASASWEVETIGEQIRLALSGKRGTVGDGFLHEATIQRDNTFSTEPRASGSDYTIKRSMDFQIFYAQTAPTL